MAFIGPFHPQKVLIADASYQVQLQLGFLVSDKDLGFKGAVDIPEVQLAGLAHQPD